MYVFSLFVDLLVFVSKKFGSKQEISKLHDRAEIEQNSQNKSH